MTEHTPTPWAVYDDDDCAISAPDRIFDDNCGWDYKTGSLLKGDEGMHGRFRNPADAAFVVRAVNSHEDLLAACQTVLDLWHSTSAALDDDEQCAMLRAAIAKATKATR